MLKSLFYFCVLLLSLGQFTSLSKSAGSNLYLFDFAVFLFGVAGAAYFLLLKKKLVFPNYSVPLGFFFFVACASLLFVYQNYDTSELLTAFLYLVRFGAYVLDAMLVYNMVREKLMTPDELFRAFVLSGLLISFAGFIQLVLLPDFETLDPLLGWDPHKNRLASTFFDPNFTGAYLVTIITLFFDRLFSEGKKLKVWEASALFILFAALLLTFSRSAWLMLAFVILIYGFFRSRLLLFAALVIAFCAYFAVPRIQTRISGATDPADSASLRLVSWKNTWAIAQDNFLLGTGFNTFRFVQKDYGFLDEDTYEIHSGAGSDSSLLFVLATTGIVGFLFYFVGLVFPIWDRFLKNRNPSWVFLTALIGSLVLNSQFINSLFYPQIMLIWLIYVFNCSSSRT